MAATRAEPCTSRQRPRERRNLPLARITAAEATLAEKTAFRAACNSALSRHALTVLRAKDLEAW